jgi:hypothetical protein
MEPKPLYLTFRAAAQINKTFPRNQWTKERPSEEGNWRFHYLSCYPYTGMHFRYAQTE